MLVVIDDDSINELGSAPGANWMWPWPRGAYADLITYLKASGAKEEIWFDLIFYTPDRDAFQDDELKAVAAAAGNVHFGQGSGDGSVSRFQPTFNVALPASDQNLVIHSDIKGEHLLAWPQAFDILRDPKALGKPSPIIPAAKLVIDGENLLKSISADDRTNPEKIAKLWTNNAVLLRDERFRDKIVYIGVSAASGYDLKAFPVGTNEPSVMIHVVTRSNELQNGFSRRFQIGCATCWCWLIALIASDFVPASAEFSSICRLRGGDHGRDWGRDLSTFYGTHLGSSDDL